MVPYEWILEARIPISAFIQRTHHTYIAQNNWQLK